MPKKKNSKQAQTDHSDVVGLRAEVLEQPITEALEVNYMPYAMSVIVSRAIPEIDGFKPSHRKLLYTMYKMKLLGGARTKSANVVGTTMKLNPHGEGAIYETMVRLSRGYGALLHPLVDSKGNFGKVYSRDMAYAASRYTEVRLDAICEEIFRDIEKDSVDFVPNYDDSMMEPSLLPTSFPNILVSANQGIAVGMASSLCGFNLAEVCDTAIAHIKKPEADLFETLLAPDLPTGGELLFDKAEIHKIYETGRGSFKVRAKWRYLAEENLIEIFEIPYSTTVEAILAKVTELAKAGRVKEISDMRDETDLSGLKLAIDLRRGVDPQKLMQKLYRATPLQDSISCNFNVLVDGMPRVMGVGEILYEWTRWREGSLRRQTSYQLGELRDKLHLLIGLRAILLDIDKAIAIIRETEEEAAVVPNLMTGFSIDETQASYVADLKLRNINRAYILRRLREVEELEAEIADLEDLLEKPQRMKKLMITQLQQVKKKFETKRRTDIIYDFAPETQQEAEEEVERSPVHLFLSREGYLKKISPQSLRMNAEQRFKEEVTLQHAWDSHSLEELLIFTNRHHCYKLRVRELEDSKASLLGEYLPAKLELSAGEQIVWATVAGDYKGSLYFCYENGKVARIPLEAYQTITRRRKLTGAYSDKSPLVSALCLREDDGLYLRSSDTRLLFFRSDALQPKMTRSSQGVQVMSLRGKHKVVEFGRQEGLPIQNHTRYRARILPALGALHREEEGEQLSLL